MGRPTALHFRASDRLRRAIAGPPRRLSSMLLPFVPSDCVREKMFFLDGQPTPDLVQSGNFDLSGMFAGLGAKVREIGARRRIVFDAVDIITGFPGTARTTLSGAFAEAASKRGERTMFVSFDSDGSEVIRNLASVEMRLDRYRKNETLRMIQALGLENRAP